MKAQLVLILTFAVTAFSTMAQDTTTIITASEKEQAIERVCQLLNRFYVLPEVATEMEQKLKARLAAGAFDAINESAEFADYLTTELRSVRDDKHLKVFLGPNPDEQSIEDRILSRLLTQLESRENNSGLNRVEVLDGNVGYLNIKSVMYSEEARDLLASSMRFLSNTEALIFDLRENDRGGDPAFMEYLFSYLFDRPTQLTGIYWRDRDKTVESWTRENVSDVTLADVPIFVLISKQTFSGAEAFAYDLQALRRATIIGEPSAGGAHPASSWVVLDEIRIAIPLGRAVNPITGTNWEGAGVIPDIQVVSEEAMQVAVKEAREAAQNYHAAQKNKVMENYEGLITALARAEHLYESGDNDQADSVITLGLRIAVERDIVNESMINWLGYSYLKRDEFSMAVSIFKFNASEFPNSANVYDSLAEAYLKKGNRELAIQYYKKALDISPDLTSAKDALTKIGK